MPPDKLVLLRSDNGVTLSKVTLADGAPKSAGVTSYTAESNRTFDVKAFATRSDVVEHYEEEVERCRVA